MSDTLTFMHDGTHLHVGGLTSQLHLQQVTTHSVRANQRAELLNRKTREVATAKSEWNQMRSWSTASPSELYRFTLGSGAATIC